MGREEFTNWSRSWQGERALGSRYFPPPEMASEDGFLCVGGRLEPSWLLDAYRHGIFPWPMWEGEPIAWWAPDPRAIIPLDAYHLSRRLARTMRSGKFWISRDQAFDQVIEGCGTTHGRDENTWLIPEMVAAYKEMHRRGHAHSVEVWFDDQLVGGTYGLAIGGLFAAESMFHTVTDASKVAVTQLVIHLREQGFQLLDVQQWTAHTGRLGAIEIARADYMERLESALSHDVTFTPAAPYRSDPGSLKSSAGHR